MSERASERVENWDWGSRNLKEIPNTQGYLTAFKVQTASVDLRSQKYLQLYLVDSL